VKVDRDVQRKILQALRAIYPQAEDSRRLQVGCDANELIANLVYLQEHGLISADWAASLAKAKITANG
jgi:hypothetical protein